MSRKMEQNLPSQLSIDLYQGEPDGWWAKSPELTHVTAGYGPDPQEAIDNTIQRILFNYRIEPTPENIERVTYDFPNDEVLRHAMTSGPISIELHFDALREGEATNEGMDQSADGVHETPPFNDPEHRSF
jgi:hypothetical protein